MLLRLGHFVCENQCVESDVTFHASAAEEFHQARQIRGGEIVSAHAGVEAFEPEINRVRAVFDSGLGAFPIASRREQVGYSEVRRRISSVARSDWLNCGLRY